MSAFLLFGANSPSSSEVPGHYGTVNQSSAVLFVEDVSQKYCIQSLTIVNVSSVGGGLLSNTMEAHEEWWEIFVSCWISATAMVYLQIHTNSVLIRHLALE